MNETWIEAAINGPWGTERQPGIPTTVEACIEQGVNCAEAGAAIIHVHAYDPEQDEQNDDPDRYARIIEGIHEETDAIVYPTIPPVGLVGDSMMSADERYGHQEELGRRSVLEWSVVDPGSMNFARYSDIERGTEGFIYQNPESHVRRGLEIAAQYGVSPSYAIYEPGFIRLGAALAEQYPGIGPPIYRFMFSEQYTFGYPPEPYALDSYLQLLNAEASDAHWMVAGLGVNITPLISEAVERGGHVRVGLEDAPLGSDRSNVDWVTHAREEIETAGGTVATAADVRDELSG